MRKLQQQLNMYLVIFSYISPRIKLNLIYLNPLFLFCGYYVYNAENEAIIISNISYVELRSLQGDRIKSYPLGNNMYLVQKKDNINKLQGTD